MFLHFPTLALWEGEGNDHVVQFALTSISVGEEEKSQQTVIENPKFLLLPIASCLLPT